MTNPLPTLALALFLVATPSLAQVAEPPAAPPNAVGMGDLLVAPTRVILEGRARSAELTLVNTGSSTATYRISFINLRMTDTGELTEIEEPGPGERFADGMIRYSPRQVTLEPNVAQTVRLQVRKPADLEAGEYRSHILFRAVPNLADMGGGIEASNPEELKIRLVPVYGVSLPVIVRHGETAASARLSDLKVTAGDGEQPPLLAATLHREGTRSVYVSMVARLRSTGEVVGQIKGIGVYVPNAKRDVALPLQIPEGRALSGETLVVTITDAETPEERTLAEAELVVP